MKRKGSPKGSPKGETKVVKKPIKKSVKKTIGSPKSVKPEKVNHPQYFIVRIFKTQGNHHRNAQS
jgi:hypothetical protein